MTLSEFNRQTKDEAAAALGSCCGAGRWVAETMKGFPFATEADLTERATTAWYNTCSETDWREAFTHHPKIGDVEGLRKKFASTAHLAGAEQSGVNSADEK